MSVTINGTTGVDTPAVTADSTNVLNLKSEGVTRAYVSASGLTVNRINSASEGGQLDLCRSSDGASSWAVDVYGSTSTPSLRFVDNIASATRMQIDGSGIITSPIGGVQLLSGTAVASTSGTSIDFTGIPSWVKRITLQISGVSTNGSSTYWVRVGAGSIATSGYRCFSSIGTSGDNSTSAYILGSQVSAGNNIYGHLVLTNLSGNTWTISSTIGMQGNYTCIGGGDIALGGALDRVRITTANGTDTFDAGSINILYE